MFVFLYPLKIVPELLKLKEPLKLFVLVKTPFRSGDNPELKLPLDPPFKFGKKLPFAMATSFSANFKLSLLCWTEIFLSKAWSTHSLSVHFF